MAKKATVFKAKMDIADTSRNVYLQTNLTFSLHPSETLNRMMLRLIAWAMFADEKLQFTKGLCVSTEPELWVKNELDDDIKLWIELGLPNEKRLKKACNLAQSVVLFTYGDKAAYQWKKLKLNKLHAFHNLTIINIVDEVLSSAAKASKQVMDIKVTIENGQMWFSIGDTILAIEPQTWKIEGF